MRLFVALDLPGTVVDALDGWAREAVRDRPGLRAVPAASLHVTLAFLGERPGEEVPAIGATVLACATPVPDLALAAPAWLPPRRPGVLAVDVDDGQGACAQLQRAVVAALAGLGALTPERRASARTSRWPGCAGASGRTRDPCRPVRSPNRSPRRP